MQLSCIRNLCPFQEKTKTVKLLLDLFYEKNNALSVVELVSKFEGQMNKTTVYRILNRLEEAGYLHSFIDKEGLKRYAKGDQRIRLDKKTCSTSTFSM